MFDKLLFELIGPVERVVFKLLHIVHLFLDRSHRIESRQRHSDKNDDDYYYTITTTTSPLVEADG